MSLSPVPSDRTSALAALRVFSLSHRTCGLSALGGVIASGDVSALRAALAASGIAAIVLSTCNRLEIYWHARNGNDDEIVAAAIGSWLPRAQDVTRDGALQLEGDPAAQHLFRVCSGLESMVLGEAEILGQARAAMEQSTASGSFLRGVFTAAIRTGRAARAETGIGLGAMSVASAAIEQLGALLAVESSRVLVIGAGETATKAARHLASIGVGQLIVANRTAERAAELAAAHRGIAVAFDDLAAEIARADAVICAANASSYLVTRSHVAERSKPIVLVDLSMPPAIEPIEAGGVTHIDLQRIDRATAIHQQRREAEIPKVETVIARELEWLRGWARHDRLRPFVSTLRQKADSIRLDELERAKQELGSDDAQAVLERFSRRMFDRILAMHVDQLKSGGVPFDDASVEYLRRLFALDNAGEFAVSSLTSDRAPALRSPKGEGG